MISLISIFTIPCMSVCLFLSVSVQSLSFIPASSVYNFPSSRFIPSVSIDILVSAALFLSVLFIPVYIHLYVCVSVICICLSDSNLKNPPVFFRHLGPCFLLSAPTSCTLCNPWFICLFHGLPCMWGSFLIHRIRLSWTPDVPLLPGLSRKMDLGAPPRHWVFPWCSLAHQSCS